MTTRIRKIVGSPGFILCASAMLAVATFLIGRYNSLSRSDWPGWLQAVGSVWAILVAVWVSWHQAELQDRREKQKEIDGLDALLRLIRIELSSTLDRCEAVFGHILESLPEGKAFLGHIPISDEPFNIYKALLPQLGAVRDAATSEQIVRTYRAATGFIITIQRHNSVFASWERPHDSGDSVAARKKHAELVSYSAELQESYREIKVEIAKLLRMLPA